MSSTYAGDDTNFPEDYTIPDDSDPPTASAVNIGLEALGDRTAWLAARLFVLSSVSVTSTGDHVAPTGAVAALLEGCGGGGGGGAGANNPGADSHASGAGGGGGSVLATRIVPIVGGDTYAVAIGAGGAGGVQDDDAPTPGAVGGDTTFIRVTGSVLLATFRGAGGGHQGDYDPGLGPDAQSYGRPGLPVRSGADAAGSGCPLASPTEDKNVFLMPTCPQMGGAGVTSNNDRLNPRAAGSPQGFAGGLAGDVDATSAGSYHGGGPGGGGGGGPLGVGGTGGDGGAPNNAGDGSPGTAGTNASANTGAGGGAGGGSGAGSTAGGIGGDGGNGGSGKLSITWLTRGSV